MDDDDLVPYLALYVNEFVFVLEGDESKLSIEIADVVLGVEFVDVIERELLEDALFVEERNVVYDDELAIAVSG